MIVVAACGQKKLPQPSAAGYLYVGSYAAAGLRWARSVALPGRIFILSAKYGLIPHDRVVEPYDLTLNSPGAVDAMAVRAQAMGLGILAESDVLAVGGSAYVRLARAVWPPVRAPFATEGGMGRQMSSMRAHLGQVRW